MPMRIKAFAALLLVGAYASYFYSGGPQEPSTSQARETARQTLSSAVGGAPSAVSPGASESSRLLNGFASDPHGALERILDLGDEAQRRAICADPNFQSKIAGAADGMVQAAGGQVVGASSADAQNFVQMWASLDPAAAQVWSEKLPEGDLRDALITRVAFVESGSSPADAANLVADEVQAGPAQEEAAMAVLHQWALRDFAGARAWANQFPEGNIRERAIRELRGLAAYNQSPTADAR